MPAKSKAQQRFMGLVHALNKGDVDPSKVSKKVKDVAKDMDKSDVKKYASTKHKGKPEKVKQEDINLETLIKENPAAIAAAVQTMQKMKAKNPKTGRVNKLSTALGDKQHPAHKKAKSVFSRIVDKFKKKKDGPNPTSKDSPLVPKKQSKADVDFYKKQFTGETIDKLKEMIRVELEGCGYTTSAVDPNIKLKSPGGTGEEDKDLKEGMKTAGDVPFGNFNFNTAGKNSIKKLAKRYGLKVKKITKGPNYEPTAVLQGDEKKLMKFLMSKDYGVDKFSAEDMIEGKLHEGEKEKIEQLLIKYGNTPEDAKQMVRKTYDYIKKAYRNANASKKAEIMSSLMKFETTEQFSNLVEKCWKGYMIHPKRKTKKLFGKTYPNCIKKEDTLYIEAMSAAQAKAAHKKFKETGELPPHLKKLVKDLDKVKVKYKVKNIVVPGLEWMADIKDEGFASDAQRRAAFASGYKAKGKKKKKNESIIESIINEIASYKQFVKYMNDFYGPKGIYPDKKKRTLKMKDIGTAYSVLLKKKPDFEIGYDSTDREMLRDILIKMRKLDPDYSQKKESVSEAMDKRQGAEALQQLGGNRFIAMTGAKHFGVGPNGMSFKIGRNSKRVNHVTIDYDRGRDLYNMKFDWVTIKGIKNKKTLKGIYADQLQDMFTKYTGMYTSL